MITTREFANRTGISIRTVRNMIADGRLKIQQESKGKQIFVDYDDYFQKEIVNKESFETPEKTYEYIRKNLKDTIDDQMRCNKKDHNAIVRNLIALHNVEKYLIEKGYFDNRESEQ